MESAQDIRQCLECKKTCIEPRSLACFHTFCLRCLIQSIEQKKTKSAKELSCPVCDKRYIVPKTGLQRNDFISRLIKTSRAPSSSSKDRVNCGICSIDNEKKAGSEIPVASVYCIECGTRMCDQCDVKHSRKNSTSSHIAFRLGSQQEHEVKESARHEGNQCLEHQKKQVELYCKECKAIICITCFAETHKSHDCIDLDKHKDPLCKQIEKNREKATGCLENCRAMRQRLDVVEREFLEAADAAEVDIDERCEELKQMVDKHEKKLKEELKRNKELKLSEISESRTRLNELVRDLKTLEAYCSELASNGSSVEMARDIAGMTERKTELQQLQEKQAEYELLSMNVSFKPRELDNFQKDANNIVGSIDVVANRVAKHVVILNLHSDVVLGVAKLKGTIYVLGRSLSTISIHTANDSFPDFGKTQEMLLTEISSPVDMVASKLNNCLYISDRGNHCIWKLTPDLQLTRWMSWVWQPMTMSISNQGHVMMARNTNPPVVDLYGSRGELIDQYRIPVFLLSPKHVVEAPNGDLIVLHKFRNWEGNGKMAWGVGRLNREGKVLCRFIPEDVSQRLCRPHRLSVDERNRVFVVDPGADRMTMLSQNLHWIRDFSTKGCDEIKNPPMTLSYDKRTKRLLVGKKFSVVYMLPV